MADPRLGGGQCGGSKIRRRPVWRIRDKEEASVADPRLGGGQCGGSEIMRRPVWRIRD